LRVPLLPSARDKRDLISALRWSTADLPGVLLNHPLLERLSPSADPLQSGRILAKALPIKQVQALGTDGDWWHQDGHLAFGALHLAAWLGSPLLLETQGHEGHCVLLQHEGQAEWRQGNGCHPLHAGEALIGPGHPWSLTTSLSSNSCFLADPHRLLRTARAMGGAHWQPAGPAEGGLHRPLPLPAHRDLAGRGLMEALSRLLPFISAIAHQGEGLVQSLRLDDQIYRLLAALVFADLRDGEEPLPALVDRKRTDACIDDLVDFIRLNLHRRLCLSDLEHQSLYSRRALHYAFRARFDCSPMQWVRQQRLARALDRLQNPLQGESVLGVALACGYRSLSQFSVDFQRAYQRKPSEVLRRGRIQNQPAPAALDLASADVAPAP